MEKGTFGSRIREQRERLGLSQVAFASKVGITGRSQRNYEGDVRVPNAEYLAAVAPLGVDVNYVLRGVEPKQSYAGGEVSHSTLLVALGLAFGLSSENMDEIVDRALVNELDAGFDPAIFFAAMVEKSEIFKLMAERFVTIDCNLLASVLEAIQGELALTGLNLPVGKQAAAAGMLYRAFRSSGRIDRGVVVGALRLAVPE